MKLRNLRWQAAAVIAFLMGVPLVESAHAQDVADITESAFSLVSAIIDAAGNS